MIRELTVLELLKENFIDDGLNETIEGMAKMSFVNTDDLFNTSDTNEFLNTKIIISSDYDFKNKHNIELTKQKKYIRLARNYIFNNFNSCDFDDIPNIMYKEDYDTELHFVMNIVTKHFTYRIDCDKHLHCLIIEQIKKLTILELLKENFIDDDLNDSLLNLECESVVLNTKVVIDSNYDFKDEHDIVSTETKKYIRLANDYVYDGDEYSSAIISIIFDIDYDTRLNFPITNIITKHFTYHMDCNGHLACLIIEQIKKQSWKSLLKLKFAELKNNIPNYIEPDFNSLDIFGISDLKYFDDDNYIEKTHVGQIINHKPFIIFDNVNKLIYTNTNNFNENITIIPLIKIKFNLNDYF